ncbi:hypothetical protein L0B53_13630 [Vibrio sp. SS-MA-C1-2]|uniref:hypothetical protein n=1 Tax=Vibrio sp. SS-MA-C1-2 TaxID=2908646 RepID=UPI001F2FD69E|nr:hypothetical protein [Vibrio sp. SS-MA-C1-2]UJF18057.1 hypothetical protein L0B53_13630 [Vibrio sp. SS-MA-C1-2]
MRITIQGGSFELAVEVPYSIELIEEAQSIYKETKLLTKSSDGAITRFLQIIIEHQDTTQEDDDACGYAIFGLLGWYHIQIEAVTSDEDVTIDLPNIMPHIINPYGDQAPTIH